MPGSLKVALYDVLFVLLTTPPSTPEVGLIDHVIVSGLLESIFNNCIKAMLVAPIQ